MSRPEIVLWEPNPARREVSLYVRRALRERLGRTRASAADKDIHELADLVAVLFGLSDIEPCRTLVRQTLRSYAGADSRRLALEAWARKHATILRTTTDGRLGVVQPSVAALTTWLERHVRAIGELANQYTRDPDTLLAFARAADIARLTGLARRDLGERFPLPLLILGETGTGKELLSRALQSIYVKSAFGTQGKEQAFGAVNCGGLPTYLIESELFGHVKGAFTGAVTGKAGILEELHQGVVLLDEIGDAPAEVQLRLLRFMNDGEVRRVGANSGTRVSPWVIGATHPKIRGEVRKSFREDLWFRISGRIIELRPLRSRGDDVLFVLGRLIADHAGFGESWTPPFTPSAKAALQKHSWYGNLRELDAVARELAALAASAGRDIATIGLSDLPHGVADPYLAASNPFDRLAHEYLDRQREAGVVAPGESAASLIASLRELYLPGPVVGHLRILDLVRAAVRHRLAARILSPDGQSTIVRALEQLEQQLEQRQVSKLRRALERAERGDEADDVADDEVQLAPDLPDWLRGILSLVARAEEDPEAMAVIDELRRLWARIPPPARVLLMHAFEMVAEDVVSQGAAHQSASVVPVASSEAVGPISLVGLRGDRVRLERELKRVGFRGTELARELDVAPREVWNLVKKWPDLLQRIADAHGTHKKAAKAMGVGRDTFATALKRG